jgi:3-oxoadipate enol-lactonase
MADDVVAVMDHAGVPRAHVVGASMGGAISQILAVRHPERVESLILACTACRHEDWRRDLFAEWSDLALTAGMREVSRVAMRWLIGPRSLRRYRPALGLLGPLALSAPPFAFANQVGAILAAPAGLAGDLGLIRAPTTIIVGSRDILTPVADAEDLAEHIPHARLQVVSGAAHGLMVEHAREFNRAVAGHFERAVTGAACAPS